MLTCMVSACCSQWVRAMIRTTNCLVLVVSHRLLSLSVVKLVGGLCVFVVVGHDGCWHCAGCVVLRLRCLELWGRGGSSSVVNLLGGRGAIVVVLLWTVVTLCFCYCVVVACSWALCVRKGLELGRQAAWRPNCNHAGVVNTVDGTGLYCYVMIAYHLGYVCGVQARSSSCLAAECSLASDVMLVAL